MKQARIEPSIKAHTLLVDIVCDCGLNGLADAKTGETNFKHEVVMGSGHDKILICGCGKRYMLHPQETHVHISTIRS